MTNLVIVQPYIPAYRVPFFTQLVNHLAEQGVHCDVLASAPQGAQALRGDCAGSHHTWWIQTSRRGVRFVGRRLDWAVDVKRVLHQADGVIVSLAGSSVDTHRAIARAKFRRQRLGLWGHVGAYVKKPHQVDVMVEKWQMRQADHVFAYGKRGAAIARDSGLNSRRVTAVMNSVDTESLERAMAGLEDAEVAAFEAKHVLRRGSTFAFVGGLDQPKRINVLAAVLNQLWVRDRDIKVLVGGRGPLLFLLAPAAARGQAVLLGQVASDQKAIIARVSRGILMPGRIGLVAVESLAMRQPILTTAWPLHAPEAEYLTEGRSLFTSPDNVDAYVDLILSTARTKPSDSSGWTYPTLEQMVANFTGGVLEMLR